MSDDPFEHAEPLDESEAAALDAALSRAREPRNDLGNARRLDSTFGDDALYGPGLGWMIWDGARYASGEIAMQRRAQMLPALVLDEARALADGPVDAEHIAAFRAEHPKLNKELSDEQIIERLVRERAGPHFAWAVDCGNNARMNAAAIALRPFREVDVRDFDTEAMRFTLPNGTLDLTKSRPIPETDELEHERAARLSEMFGPHCRDDRATKCGGVDFDAKAVCPRWEALLESLMPDPDDRAYLQRVAGYWLRGDNREQCFVMLLGRGGNGKSTFMRLVRYVLGDSLVSVREDAFIETKGGGGEGPNPAECEWVGCRLYFADEIKKGARLNAAMLNGLTGGNPRQSRQLREPMFTWDPRGVPVLNVNKLPPLGDDSAAMLRRALVVHWRQTISELPAAQRMTEDAVAAMMAEEAPGFLNWMLDGYAEYAEIGFAPPDSALRQMTVLKAETDPVGNFLNAMTRNVTYGAKIKLRLFNNVFALWCEDNGVRAPRSTEISKAMTARDFQKMTSNGTYWVNIDWLDVATAEERGFDDPDAYVAGIVSLIERAERED